MDPTSIPPPDPWTARWIDGGPVYAESVFTRPIAEPFNAATAALFIVVALAWIVRLRGRYRQHPFLVGCLPLLLAGGIGGTLYHALRTSRLFFLLDVVPISLLGLAVSLHLAWKLRPKAWQVIGVLLAYVGITGLTRGLSPHLAISTSYALLAILVMLPTLLILAQTRLRHGGWVGLALVSFAVGLVFRIIDAWRPPILPMGTHWLWHLGGAGCTAALSEYLYRLEAEP